MLRHLFIVHNDGKTPVFAKKNYSHYYSLKIFSIISMLLLRVCLCTILLFIVFLFLLLLKVFNNIRAIFCLRIFIAYCPVCRIIREIFREEWGGRNGYETDIMSHDDVCCICAYCGHIVLFSITVGQTAGLGWGGDRTIPPLSVGKIDLLVDWLSFHSKPNPTI